MVKKLSLQEYKEIGTETKFLRERLMHLDIKVSKGIGKSKRESDQLRTITIKLDQFISDLEKLMFSQYYGEAGCNFEVFYGLHELPNDLQVNEALK